MARDRQKVRFKQADVSRALKAARDAGLAVARFEIDAEGKIVVVSAAGAPPAVVDELEAWRAQRNARAS